MIGIKGPRGAGKTTLLLQHLKFDLKMTENALYLTADHTWFYNHSLLDTAMEWYKTGGRVLAPPDILVLVPVSPVLFVNLIEGFLCVL